MYWSLNKPHELLFIAYLVFFVGFSSFIVFVALVSKRLLLRKCPTGYRNNFDVRWTAPALIGGGCAITVILVGWLVYWLGAPIRIEMQGLFNVFAFMDAVLILVMAVEKVTGARKIPKPSGMDEDGL